MTKGGWLKGREDYTNVPTYDGAKRFCEKKKTKWLVSYMGFEVRKNEIGRSRNQLGAITALTDIQKQFIGTMIDTEVAEGYFFRKSPLYGDSWVSYVAVKMKYGGDLKYFAQLISHLPPSRGWYANTIKHSLDRRWSLNIQGIVAFTLIHGVRPYLHNEKSIIEADCILEHGPMTDGRLPHPFVLSGANKVRRGVWYWPQIDNENEVYNSSTANK
jgi:hypothetical protein